LSFKNTRWNLTICCLKITNSNLMCSYKRLLICLKNIFIIRGSCLKFDSGNRRNATLASFTGLMSLQVTNELIRSNRNLPSPFMICTNHSCFPLLCFYFEILRAFNLYALYYPSQVTIPHMHEVVLLKNLNLHSNFLKVKK